jgi:hypothetical protein
MLDEKSKSTVWSFAPHTSLRAWTDVDVVFKVTATSCHFAPLYQLFVGSSTHLALQRLIKILALTGVLEGSFALCTVGACIFLTW